MCWTLYVLIVPRRSAVCYPDEGRRQRAPSRVTAVADDRAVGVGHRWAIEVTAEVTAMGSAP
ncbi:hypothetical protein GCM10010254_01050 [Streptomyces chromofuscus]|nr:hypothetical protein GCM10010254_01050 [Streptomyces chromofuscus]